MFPSFNRFQQGFSMPIVVFILVIMSLLAAGILQLSSRSNMSATQEELSNRAFYAAESGAQWAMSRLFFNAGAPATRNISDAACDNLGAMPNIGVANGLASCTVAVTCTCPNTTLANCGAQIAGEPNFYNIVSTGTCGTGQVLGVRRIAVGARNQ